MSPPHAPHILPFSRYIRAQVHGRGLGSVALNAGVFSVLLPIPAPPLPCGSQAALSAAAFVSFLLLPRGS